MIQDSVLKHAHWELMPIYKHVLVLQDALILLLLTIQHANVFQFALVHLLCFPILKVWNVSLYAILAITRLTRQDNACKIAQFRVTTDKILPVHVLKVAILLKKPSLII